MFEFLGKLNAGLAGLRGFILMAATLAGVLNEWLTGIVAAMPGGTDGEQVAWFSFLVMLAKAAPAIWAKIIGIVKPAA